ncbi:CBO0543 family protein [Lederbergia panacisoli]|uniref:CBO0543 family protein n=1 Tax=Lederbergia panacisoli TaxID=1255251 RepID=UPI00214C3EE5|nr:CBO0543 family protein [Lederbergia panacisoli]MCR2820947.1 hypothetical protein [Lederbergia panacisoli]
MTIVKHWKSSNSRQWRKLSYLNRHSPYFVTIAIAALLGTFLDFYYVSNGYYEFPIRPFPEVFSVNIGFTFFILPFMTWLYLLLMKKINKIERLIVILMICFLVPLGEMISEKFGFFSHANTWNHSSSFIGYFLYLIIIWKLFQSLNKSRDL